MYYRIINYINKEKNLKRLFLFIVLFLCIMKLPSLLSTDIQPWDEGMYATRVLSILINKDFFDQSKNSVGGFYSGSHPPLLIWIGYIFTLIFGINGASLKIIPFISGLICILLIMLISKKVFNPKTGFFAALIFSSNIIFNIFSKRFQFDIPYTALILLSFYFFFLYMEKQKIIYNVLGGIIFGLCLMVKILVGFFIPVVIFFYFLFTYKERNYKFSDLATFTLVGILIALPWHMYMILNYGNDFLEYFFGYHIYDRVMRGVEHNEKASGFLYYFNYLFSIIPYSIIVFVSFIHDIINRKFLKSKKLFFWIWFILCLVVISILKTKLEVYVLLILTPASFLIAKYIEDCNESSFKEKFAMVFLLHLNIIWFALSSPVRNEIKAYISLSENYMILVIWLLIIISACTIVSYIISKRINTGQLLYLFVFIFFLSINAYYFFNIPKWENTYEIKNIKTEIEKSGKKNIIYIGSNYRYNPQFSFYFNGLNIGWKSDKYKYELIDTKAGTEEVKNYLDTLEEGVYNIIVEGDNINRSEYPDPSTFIPEEFHLIKETRGYKLYEY